MSTKFGRVQKSLAFAAVAVILGYAATVVSAGFVSTTHEQYRLEMDDLFAIQNAEAAAVDYFLKIDGIEGESIDQAHKDWIEIHSWNWGMSQSGRFAAGGGAGSGKVVVMDYNFEKPMDKSTPKLMQACANGQHIKEAVLVARMSGERPVEYLTIKFTDLLISSYQTSASGDVPMESMSFSFAKMDIEYKPQNPDGSLGDPVRGSFDFAKSIFR